MKGFPNGQCSHSSHYRGALHQSLCLAIQPTEYKNKKNNRPKMDECRQKLGKNRQCVIEFRVYMQENNRHASVHILPSRAGSHTELGYLEPLVPGTWPEISIVLWLLNTASRAKESEIYLVWQLLWLRILLDTQPMNISKWLNSSHHTQTCYNANMATLFKPCVHTNRSLFIHKIKRPSYLLTKGTPTLYIYNITTPNHSLPYPENPILKIGELAIYHVINTFPRGSKMKSLFEC